MLVVFIVTLPLIFLCFHLIAQRFAPNGNMHIHTLLARDFTILIPCGIILLNTTITSYFNHPMVAEDQMNIILYMEIHIIALLIEYRRVQHEVTPVELTTLLVHVGLFGYYVVYGTDELTGMLLGYMRDMGVIRAFANVASIYIGEQFPLLHQGLWRMEILILFYMCMERFWTRQVVDKSFLWIAFVFPTLYTGTSSKGLQCMVDRSNKMPLLIQYPTTFSLLE